MYIYIYGYTWIYMDIYKYRNTYLYIYIHKDIYMDIYIYMRGLNDRFRILCIPSGLYTFDFIFVRTPRTHGNSEFGRLEAIHAGLSLTYLAVPSDWSKMDLKHWQSIIYGYIYIWMYQWLYIGSAIWNLFNVLRLWFHTNLSHTQYFPLFKLQLFSQIRMSESHTSLKA
jgi:hypothetical protein